MSDIVTWRELEGYFTDMREQIIIQLGAAPSDHDRTICQGKLALCNELMSLREALDTMALAKKDEERVAVPFARTLEFRQRIAAERTKGV